MFFYLCLGLLSKEKSHPADVAAARMLEEQGQRLGEALPKPHQRSTPVSYPSFLSSPQFPPASPAFVSNRLLERETYSHDTQFLLPFGHSATLLRLLSLPSLRAIVGGFETSYFFDLEESASLPRHLDPTIQHDPVDSSLLEPDRLRAFADAYFSEVSAHLPLLTREYYNGVQDRVIRSGLVPNTETAICLCVWALGSIASLSSSSSSSSPPMTTATFSENLDSHPSESLGAHYFAAAMRIVVPKALLQLTPNTQMCQVLLLAATYFSYMGRPLHSWKMVQSAAQKILEILQTSVSQTFSRRWPLDSG